MRPFEHIDVTSFEEASELMAKGKADALAGGTDLMGTYKHAILKESPEKVINLKTIPNAAGIEEKDGKIVIKALTKLVDAAESPVLLEKAKAVADAAYSVATPLIRNMGTVGGNICQDVRCWYYRYAHELGGRMDCSRKGGDVCFAIKGENRYHSIFGGMKTHKDPCSKGCPAGTDIPAYMEQIRKGNWDKAAEIIMQVNPMPMCTSRICPHPCEDGCNQCQYGESVGIHCVERTLGDYILANADKFYVKPAQETGKKAAIVGAGPGGLSAAYYLRKAGHDVTVIDSHEKAGGVLQYGIPHYRLPKNIVDAYAKALENMGVKFQMNTEVGKDITMEEITESYDSIYLGIGAWKQPILGIQGEELTVFGLDFLVEVNTFLKKAIDNDVLICGGGNVAMDVALTAKRMGAKNVRLVCLEQEAEMPASKEEVARAKEEGVEIYNGWGLKSVKYSGLEAMKCTSVYDENGRFKPVYDEGETCIFEGTTIILATGQKVDTSFLGSKWEAQLKTQRGLLEADAETYQTKEDKIFAGGDAVTGPNIAIRAIRAGGVAAKMMSKKMGDPIATMAEDNAFLTYDVEGIKKTESAKLQELSVAERTLTDEDSASLSMEQAAEEAKRCMNCGCYSVNASDLSPVVVALDGTVVTTKKEIPARDFFTTKLKAYDMLDQDELVTAIEIPVKEGYITGYEKMRVRDAIDFALVSLAYAYKLEDGKIADISLVLGGVAPVPVKLDAVEELLVGKVPTEEVAEEAGTLAVAGTMPMEMNTYKVNTAKAIVKRMLEGILK